MHIAAEIAKIEVVEMLLKAGLDLTIKDRVRILTSSRANIANIVQLPQVKWCCSCNTMHSMRTDEKRFPKFHFCNESLTIFVAFVGF